MTSAAQYHRVSHDRISRRFLRRLCAAITARRQAQADLRVAHYLRELPDKVLLRSGISPSQIKKLRDNHKTFLSTTCEEERA